MKETKKVKTTYENDHVISVTCDICHKKYNGDHWNSGYYTVDETEISITIRHKVGDSYPEGGSGTELEIDICPTCFKDKLVPWIKSYGSILNEKEWDF